MMATIVSTSVSNSEASLATVTTLDGTADTFTLPSSGLLILANNTGGALTPVITGDEATTVTCSGVGVIDVSGGTDVFGTIADGEIKVLKVNIVKDYLLGTIEITGGTGLEAQLLEF